MLVATYDHAIRDFVGWYCSEPRLAFNRTVVLRYRIHLEQRLSCSRWADDDAGDTSATFPYDPCVSP